MSLKCAVCSELCSEKIKFLDSELVFGVNMGLFPHLSCVRLCMLIVTSKYMHGMNQTEAEYSRHGKRSQRATLSQIGPVVLEV